METYKEKTTKELEVFVRNGILESFKILHDTTGIKIIQKIDDKEEEIPIGTDHIEFSVDFINQKLRTNLSLKYDVDLILKNEKQEIINREGRASWQALGKQS